MILHSSRAFNSLIYFIVLSVVTTAPIELSDEEKYVKHFGNKANNSNEWYKIKSWLNEEGQLKVKKLCAAAHRKLIGIRGHYIIDSLAYKTGTLTFNCSKYHPMRVYFLEYGLQSKEIPQHVKDYMYIVEDERWYVTQGLQKQCVFYLTLVNSSTTEFNLLQHVCGLKHNYI